METARLDPGALRRGTLAASVLDDIPLEPRDDGVVVGRSWDDRDAWTPVLWTDLADALGGADPESPTGRLRLRDWLHAYTFLTHLPPWVQPAPGDAVEQGSLAAPDAPPSRVVALALPIGHALHPGASWVVESVLGGVLDVGLALRPDAAPAADRATAVTAEPVAVPLPPGAALAAGVETSGWWAPVSSHRDAMAVLAAERLLGEDQGVLRPIGGCDVPTLLSGRWLRDRLATDDGTGMRAVAVPVRSRGWFDLARIDPAFVGAAAAATEPERRGASRPLLVTTDEVGLAVAAVPVARLAQESLADPGRTVSLHDRDVLYR